MVLRYDLSDMDSDLVGVICCLSTRLLCVEHIFQDRIAIVSVPVSEGQNAPVEFSSPKETVSKN